MSDVSQTLKFLLYSDLSVVSKAVQTNKIPEQTHKSNCITLYN